MKKITRYFAMLLGGLALTCLTACSDDDTREASPTVDPNCIGAAFDGTNVGTKELEETDPTEIKLTVIRDKTDAAATVNIEVQANTDNVFKIPQSVSFAAGQAKADLIITFPDAGLKKDYSFEISLESSAVNPYKGNSNATFTIQRLRWVTIPGVFTFKDWVFDGQGYDVEVQRVEGENRYRIVNPFEKALEGNENGDIEAADEYLYFTINPNNNGVSFDTYSTGYFQEDGSLIVGLSALDFLGIDDVNSKYDPKVNPKTVTFNVYYYGESEEEGAGGLIGQKESVLILPADFELISAEE